MQKNPYSGYNSPIGASLGNLMQSLFAKPRVDNTARDNLYNAQRQQALANVGKINAETQTTQNDMKRLNTSDSGIAKAVRSMYGPLIESQRPNEAFMGPMPQNTRGQQVQQFLPDLQTNLVKSGVKGKDLGNMVRSFVMNSGLYKDPRVGAFIGSGDEFLTSSGANAITLGDQNRLIEGENTQATNLENIKQTGETTRNDAGIAGQMARQVQEQNNKKLNPENFTLTDGAARYDSKGKLIAENKKDGSKANSLTRLKPGEIAIDAKGNVIGQNNKNYGKAIKLKPGEVAMFPNGKKIGEGNNIKAKTITLSPGQIVVDESGKEIAKGAPIAGKAPVQKVLRAGDTLVDSTGKILQKIPQSKQKNIKVGYDQAVVDPNTGEIILAAKPKPINNEQKMKIAKFVRTTLTDGGGQYGRPTPPDYEEILSKVVEGATRGEDITSLLRDAVKNSKYIFNPGKEDTAWIGDNSEKAGWELKKPPEEKQPTQTQSNIPPAAINMLRKNPSMAPAFDKKYGAGEAQKILNGV